MRKEIRSTSDMMNLNAVSRKNGTETAVAAQKQKGNEAAQAKAHAEGGVERKAAASDAHAEAAVAAQEQKEAETAKKKTQAEGWTNEGATGSRSKKTEISDDEIKRLIKEKRTIAREDKQQLKGGEQEDQEVHQDQEQVQKGKRRYSRSLRSSVESRTHLRSNPQGKRHSSSKRRMKKEKR